MLINLEDFKADVGRSNVARRYNILFVGMSHSGKTHWSKLMAERFGYRHVEFDQLIGNSEEVSNLIRNIEGQDAAEKMGKYFGMPWKPGFQEKEDAYLVVERRIMSQNYGAGSILDLTGSAIYVPDQLKRLAESGLVVYLATSEEARGKIIEKMLKDYVEMPKPVCWNGEFNQNPGEEGVEALKRCYPQLVESRAKLYAKISDISLPFDVHKNLTDADGFMGAVYAQLKANN
jgi:shikimate kinase